MEVLINKVIELIYNLMNFNLSFLGKGNEAQLVIVVCLALFLISIIFFVVYEKRNPKNTIINWYEHVGPPYFIKAAFACIS